MTSPRKSVRKRVNISYAKLLDEESDDEFFHNKYEAKPMKKKKTTDSDEEFTEDSPTSSPKKQKVKKVVNSSSKNRKTVKDSSLLLSKPIQQTPIPLSKEPIITATKIGVSPVINPAIFTSPDISTKSPPPVFSPKCSDPPSTSLTKDSTFFHVTPSSGLRIGLSRKNIKKSLHSHIRFSN